MKFEMPGGDRPAYARSMTFDHRPEESDLAEPLGWGEVGGGNKVDEDEDGGRWMLLPQLIPVRIAGWWMTFVLIGCIAVSIWFAIQSPWMWPSVLIGLVMGAAAVPAMIGLFAFVNARQGSEPYAIIDPDQNVIQLPRLQREWPINQVDSVWLTRFADQLTQVTIVVRESDDRWTHAHVINGVGAMRLKEIASPLAAQLGCETHQLKFNRRETRQMFRDRNLAI